MTGVCAARIGLLTGPTAKPTAGPTTHLPTVEPTAVPTSIPTVKPTEPPSDMPTESPTVMPTVAPTEPPTDMPTEPPTVMPTVASTEPPTTLAPSTQEPSFMPTASPTGKPSTGPTDTPTKSPTDKPTAAPSFAPSAGPTADPTNIPTTATPTIPTCKAAQCYCTSKGGDTCDGSTCATDQCAPTMFCEGGGYWCYGTAEPKTMKVAVRATLQLTVVNLSTAKFDEAKPRLTKQFAKKLDISEDRIVLSIDSTAAMMLLEVVGTGTATTIDVTIKPAASGSGGKPPFELQNEMASMGAAALTSEIGEVVPGAKVTSSDTLATTKKMQSTDSGSSDSAGMSGAVIGIIIAASVVVLVGIITALHSFTRPKKATGGGDRLIVQSRSDTAVA